MRFIEINMCNCGRCRQKQYYKFNFLNCASQEIDIVEECPGIELNSNFREFVEKTYYLLDTGARGGVVDSTLTKTKE